MSALSGLSSSHSCTCASPLRCALLYCRCTFCLLLSVRRCHFSFLFSFLVVSSFWSAVCFRPAGRLALTGRFCFLSLVLQPQRADSSTAIRFAHVSTVRSLTRWKCTVPVSPAARPSRLATRHPFPSTFRGRAAHTPSTPRPSSRRDQRSEQQPHTHTPFRLRHG